MNSGVFIFISLVQFDNDIYMHTNKCCRSIVESKWGNLLLFYFVGKLQVACIGQSVCPALLNAITQERLPSLPYMQYIIFALLSILR